MLELVLLSDGLSEGLAAQIRWNLEPGAVVWGMLA